MCTIKRKLEKLILKGDPEGKQRVWNSLAKAIIGCQCCQHYNKKANRRKNGHQDILEERHGLQCDYILPSKVR